MPEAPDRGLSGSDPLAALPPQFRSIDAWAAHWKDVAPDRATFVDRDGFLHPGDRALAHLEPHREAILSAAGRLLRHDIQGWGDVSVQHGPVVDFAGNAYGQYGTYGFHYWTWSQPLIHAHLLTRDRTYLDEFERLFNQWFEQRDRVEQTLPHLHPIWYELGLALRSRPFVEFYCLRPACSRVTHERILKTLFEAALWLHGEQLPGYRAGNWQIMGAYGLALLAKAMPEFAASAEWLSTALIRLGEHAEKDFFRDGCHSERCPSSYSIVAYRDFRNLVTLLGEDHPESAYFRSHIGSQRDFLLSILPPDGYLPGINDGERAPAPPLLLCDGQSPGQTSVHFSDSGFTTLRATSLYVLINHGPIGGGHTHADALSFEFHADHPVAIDAGIGRTYDDPLHLPWYTRAAAHNMVGVDGADPDRRAAVGTDMAFAESPGASFFAATHEGYVQTRGVRHRRHVALVRGTYCVVYDVLDILVDGPRTLAWHLHLADPALSVLPAETGWTRKVARGRASVRGIASFVESHADVDWLTLQRTAGGPARVTLAVLLCPRDSAAIRFTGRDGHYILSDGDTSLSVTFESHAVHVTSATRS